MSQQVDKEVDASGLNCPLPILRAKKALAEMQSGEVLKVTAAKHTGNELLLTEKLADAFVFYLKRR
ncbi:MAG: Sulfurtransferase TusA [Pseudomonadota bacterium]